MRLLKPLILFCLLICCSAFIDRVFAQGGVSINPTGDSPDSSAALDIDYPEKGLLVPRMTTTQRNNIASPELSLLIFNTTDSCFQAWSGSQWENIKCFGGCQASAGPTSATASPSSVCPGTTTSLSVSGGSLGTGASWEWYTSSCGGAPVGTGSSITVSPESDTMYYVRAESNCNITSCASTMVSVKTESTVPDSATASPATVCPGSSSTLSVAGGALGTSASWNWYASNCGNNPVGTGSSISVSPNSTTIYYVRAEGDCNQTACVSTSVTVSSTPNPSASSNSPVCQGNSINLSTGTYNNYNWSGPNGFSSTNQNPTIPNATPVKGGSYTVTVSDGSNCSATASTNVTVNSNPTASASSNSPVCEGNTINLTTGSYNSYNWSGPNSFSSNNQNPGINNASTADAGTYDVTVTNASGCSDSASTSVTINSNSTAPSSASASPNPVPSGSSTTLSVSGGSLGTGASWTWYQGGCGSGSSIGTGSSITVSPSSQTTYYVRAEGTCNTTSCASVTVSVTNSLSQMCLGLGDSSGDDFSGGPDQMMILTSNNNYVMAGRTSNSQPFIGKIDGQGALVDTFVLTNSDASGVNAINQTNDGGFIVAGGWNVSFFPSITAEIFVLKLDSNLNTSWFKTFSAGSDRDFVEDIIQTNDGGYAISGETENLGPGTQYNAYIVKLDANGNLMWENAVGGSGGRERGNAIIQTNDNGFAVGGRTETFGPGNSKNMFVFKLNNSGALQWGKGLGGDQEYDSVNDIIQTSDGSFAVTGRSNQIGVNGSLGNAYVVKLDQNGIDWTKAVGSATDSLEQGNSIVQTNGDDFLIAGESASFGADNSFDMYAFKLNNSGNLQWTKTAGGAGANDEGHTIVQTPDGGFAVAGQTNNFGPGSNENLALVKFDQNNSACCTLNTGGNEFSGGQVQNGGSEAGPSSSNSTTSQTPQETNTGSILLNCSQN